MLTKIKLDRKYHTNSNLFDFVEENKKIIDKSDFIENSVEPQVEPKHERMLFGESRYEPELKTEVKPGKTFYSDAKNNSIINSLKNKSLNSTKEIRSTSEQKKLYDGNNTSSSKKLVTKNQIILQRVNPSSIDITIDQYKQVGYPELKTEANISGKKHSLESHGQELNKNPNSAVGSKISQTREKQEKSEKTRDIKNQLNKIQKNSISDNSKGNTNSLGKSCEKKSSLIGLLINKQPNYIKSGSKNLNEKINIDAFSNSKLEVVTKIYSTNTSKPSKKTSVNDVVLIKEQINSSKLKSQIEKNKNIMSKNIEINLNKRNVSTTNDKSQNLILKKNFAANLNSANKKNLNLAKIPLQKTFELNLNSESPDSKTLKSTIKSTTDNMALNDSSWSLNSSNNVINEIMKIKKSSVDDHFLDKSNSQKNVILLTNLETNNSSPIIHKPKNLNKNFLVPTVRTNLYDENELSGNDSSSNSLSDNNSCSLVNERNSIKRNTERSGSLRRKLSDARDKKLIQKHSSGMIETVKKISGNIFRRINDDLNEIRNNLSIKSKISNDSQNLQREEYYSENFDNKEEINEKYALSPE